MRLTMQDQRIDGAPDIVNRCVGDDLHLARFGIHLDFADLRSVRKARDRKRLIGDAVPADFGDPLGDPCA